MSRAHLREVERLESRQLFFHPRHRDRYLRACVYTCVYVSLERFQSLSSRRVSRYGRKRGYDRDNANTDPARSDSWSLGDLTIDLCLGIVYRSNWKWPDTLVAMLIQFSHSILSSRDAEDRIVRSSRSRNWRKIVMDFVPWILDFSRYLRFFPMGLNIPFLLNLFFLLRSNDISSRFVIRIIWALNCGWV